jgi:hypothetical protein
MDFLERRAILLTSLSALVRLLSQPKSGGRRQGWTGAGEVYTQTHRNFLETWSVIREPAEAGNKFSILRTHEVVAESFLEVTEPTFKRSSY